jgi:transposase
VLRVARRCAVKARTAALNQLRGLMVSAPAELRESLSGLAEAALIGRCAAFRVDNDRAADPAVATKAALRALAVASACSATRSTRPTSSSGR